jgi:hypothetical protein
VTGEPVDLVRSDRRRDWGLLFLAGGGMAMTAYAGCALYLVRAQANLAFWLGMAAMGLVGVVLTGFAGLIVKRTLRLSRDGLEVADLPPPPGEA